MPEEDYTHVSQEEIAARQFYKDNGPILGPHGPLQRREIPEKDPLTVPTDRHYQGSSLQDVLRSKWAWARDEATAADARAMGYAGRQDLVKDVEQQLEHYVEAVTQPAPRSVFAEEHQVLSGDGFPSIIHPGQISLWKEVAQQPTPLGHQPITYTPEERATVQGWLTATGTPKEAQKELYDLAARVPNVARTLWLMALSYQRLRG